MLRRRDAGYEGRLVARLRRRGEDADYAELRARAGRAVPVWARAVVPVPCPACRGTGGGVWNDCGYCGGNGVV